MQLFLKSKINFESILLNESRRLTLIYLLFDDEFSDFLYFDLYKLLISGNRSDDITIELESSWQVCSNTSGLCVRGKAILEWTAN